MLIDKEITLEEEKELYILTQTLLSELVNRDYSLENLYNSVIKTFFSDVEVSDCKKSFSDFISLFTFKDKNYAVYYTRTTDTYPSLTDRSDLANNVGADYFLSCHINSAGATAKGSETLYNSHGYKATNGVTSYKWAANVHNFTKAATGFTNRGLVDRTGLAVLRHTKTASTLTEFGFISNKSEAASMKTNTDKYGKAMYDSVVKMFKTNPSKR